MNPNALEFGTAIKEFSISKMIELWKPDTLDEAKKYALQYFLKLGTETKIMIHKPAINGTITLDYVEIKKMYLKKKIFYESIKGKKYCEILFSDWFIEEYDTMFTETFDPTKSLVYVEDEDHKLNLFKGYQYGTRPTEPFSDELLKKVDFIWKHFEETWCSSKPALFEYVKQWICHSMSRKVATVLFLRAKQGAGKSIGTDFLCACLGLQNVLITEDPMDVFGAYNDIIKDKLLCIFEELPCASTGEWLKISEKLKQKVTGKTQVIKEKYRNSLPIPNFLSFMICSNNPCIKIDQGDRRYCCLDVSNSKKGNKQYFTELASYTMDPEVQRAFFWTARDLADAKFNEDNPPMTDNKHDLIIDNMHSVFQFIKDEYVLKNLDLNCKYSKFYDAYEKYCILHNKKYLSKIQTSRKLMDFDIDLVTGTGNVKEIKETNAKLLTIYKANNWLHDMDEYVPNKYDELKNIPISNLEADLDELIDYVPEKPKKSAKTKAGPSVLDLMESV